MTYCDIFSPASESSILFAEISDTYFKEVMGYQTLLALPAHQLYFKERLWTNIKLPTSLSGFKEGCNSTKTQDRTLKNSLGKIVARHRHQRTDRTYNTLQSHIDWLTHKLVNSPLSEQEFCVTLRVPKRILYGVKNSLAYTELIHRKKVELEQLLEHRFKQQRNTMLMNWSARHLWFQNQYLENPAFRRHTAFATGVDNEGIEETTGINEGSHSRPAQANGTDPNSRTSELTALLERLAILSTSKETNLKLDFKFKKFNGSNEDDWFRFKKNILAYLSCYDISRDTLAEYVKEYRLSGTLPDAVLSRRLGQFLSSHLVDVAQDLVVGAENGFVAYMKLVERFEHLRLSRFLKLSERLYSGVVFQNDVDKLFRDFREINLLLADFQADLDHRLLLSFILRSLPASYMNAKSVIGLRESISLTEAQAIIQTHHDQLAITKTARALSTTPKQDPSIHNTRDNPRLNPKRSSNDKLPRTPGAKCSKCGFYNHTGDQCRKTQGYKCKDCSGNHLERMCPNKRSSGPVAMMTRQLPFLWSDIDDSEADISKTQYASQKSICQIGTRCIVFTLKLNQICRFKVKQVKSSKTKCDSGDWRRIRGHWFHKSVVEAHLIITQAKIQQRGMRQFRAPINSHKLQTSTYLGKPCRRYKQFKSSNRRKLRRNNCRKAAEGELRPRYAFMTAHKAVLEILIDSGSTCHIVKDRTVLSDYCRAPLPPIVCANGAHITPTGYGTINCGSYVIENVVHCPDATVNLLSVPTLIDKGWNVRFTNRECILTHSGRKIIGYRVGSHFFVFVDSRSDGVHSFATLSSKERLHRRYAHVNDRYLELLEKTTNGSDTDIDKAPCKACVDGKLLRKPVKKQYSADRSERLSTVFTDFSGPFPGGLHGYRLYQFYTHYASGYYSVYPSSKKDEEAACLSFECYKNRYSDFSTIQADSDGCFRSGRYHALVVGRGIKLKLVTPRRHELHGPVERAIGVINAKARSLLAQTDLDPVLFWCYAVASAVFIHNRTPNHDGTTPYEKRFGMKPDNSMIRVWGCRVKVLKPPPRPKHQPVAFEGRLIGFPWETHSYGTYTVWNPETKSVIHSRDVVFFEDDLTEKKSDADSIQVEMNFESTIQDTATGTAPTPECADMPGLISDDNSDTELEENDTETVIREHAETEGSELIERLRRSPRIRKPRELYDPSLEASKPQLSSSAKRTQSAYVTEPPNWRDALKHPLWSEAMIAEWNALRDTATVKKIQRSKGMHIIPTRWVFKYKPHEVRAKARVVVLGFLQKANEIDTYAPTASYQAVRLLITRAAMLGLTLEQLDVSTAFLNADAPEGTYIQGPPGLHELFPGDYDRSDVFELGKSLYGLATSPRRWYDTLVQSLKEYGLHPSRIEPCLFCNTEGTIFILVYVDDLLMAGLQADVDRFKSFISGKYKVRMQGSADLFCGIEIRREGQVMTISQSNYIEKILERFGMIDCRPIGTPLESEPEKATTDTQDHKIAKIYPYRELLGCLMYVMTQTRVDLAFPLSILSRFSHNYNETHWKAAKRVLRYLQKTKNYRLQIEQTKTSKCTLTCYSDSDWGADSSRKSTTGIVICVNETPLLWYSKRQSLVALSSSEAEVIALCEAVKKLNFVKQLLIAGRIEFEEPTVVYGDNQASLIISRQGSTSRTKHLDLRKFFIKDEIDENRVLLKYIPTAENLADICTKCLKRPVLEHLCSRIFCLEDLPPRTTASSTEGIIPSPN